MPKNSIIIIREYDLDLQSRYNFAKEIFNLRKNRQDIKILIGKDIHLALKLKANGIHFSDNDIIPLKFLQKKSFHKDFIFSFACHSEKSLKKAQKIKPNLVFLSPIFATTSHHGAKSFGSLKFVKIITQNKNSKYACLPIFALGGINKNNLKFIKKLKIKGFGAIDYFLN